MFPREQKQPHRNNPTEGTFLGGRILTGEHSYPAGRAGEFPATGLSACLRELGFTLRRLQTNTPPRVDARRIDFSQTVPQLGSETPLYFSDQGIRKSGGTDP